MSVLWCDTCTAFDISMDYKHASKCVLKMSSLYKFKAGNSSFEHEEISSTSQVSSQPLCEGIQTLVVTYGIPLFCTNCCCYHECVN